MEAQALGFAVAFTAGLLSFLSPCVLPLIPSYASFITGLGLDELTARDGDRAQARKAVLTHGILFILGFTLVFIALGASATFLGSLFAYYRTWVERLGEIGRASFRDRVEGDVVADSVTAKHGTAEA